VCACVCVLAVVFSRAHVCIHIYIYNFFQRQQSRVTSVFDISLSPSCPLIRRFPAANRAGPRLPVVTLRLRSCREPFMLVSYPHAHTHACTNTHYTNIYVSLHTYIYTYVYYVLYSSAVKSRKPSRVSLKQLCKLQRLARKYITVLF